IVWLDGEALCVTEDFWREIAGQTPRVLRLRDCSRQTVASQLIRLSNGHTGILVRRSQTQPVRWLWCKLRRRRMISPEVRQAGLLFRKQLNGEPGHRLLAFGQRQR